MSALKQWKLAGFVAIVSLGVALHYVFSWIGESTVLGAFVPVNESVWEHLKLGYWAVVLFSIPEFFRLKDRVDNYFLTKLVGVVALELTILIIFYGYTSLAWTNILVIDIFSDVTGVFVCQYLVHYLFRFQPFSRLAGGIAVTGFIAIGVLFAIATYYPPHLPIFRDDNFKTYGISKEQ